MDTVEFMIVSEAGASVSYGAISCSLVYVFQHMLPRVAQAVEKGSGRKLIGPC